MRIPPDSSAVPPHPRPGQPQTNRGGGAAAVLDAVLVVVFAAIGRTSHAEADPVVGALGTAWPFLLGAAVGWALVRWRSGRYPLRLGAGIPVWACSVALGMLLRAVTGQGTAASFVLVASLVLGVLLLGWRAVVAGLAARLAARRTADGTLPPGDGR